METQELEQDNPDDLSPDDCNVAEPATLEDSFEPPPGLASRTCMRIWAAMDREKEDYTPNSGTFLDSAFFSPETVLPPSYLLGTSEPEEVREVRYEAPKPRKRLEIHEEPPRRSHWIGLVASISVGMVIAGFLFPVIIYVTRSTQSHVTEHWVNEINRRVGNYEQIHANHGNTPHSEELLPYNLAASRWQELRADAFILSQENRVEKIASRIVSSGGLQTPFVAAIGPAYANPYIHETLCEIAHKHQFPVFLLEDFTDWNVLVSLDMNAMADSMLLVTPEQGSSVRSAFGQNILLRDGRVFFRILPGVETPRR